jgi:hypothetical protein
MRFFAFLWDFVVGDDWRAAFGIAVAIVLAALLVAAGVNAWWVIPIAVPLVLGMSLRRAASSAG